MKINYRSRSLIVLVLAAMVTWCSPAWGGGFRSVVVVSIDALHPDALVSEYAPRTLAMLDKGNITLKGLSTDPPKTLVSHAAMVTGIGPDKGGRISNEWEPGEPTVKGRTIFHDAKEKGFRTGFFYSKPKLGFLVSDAVDEKGLVPDDVTGRAARFLRQQGRNFVFIHISGLDIVGPQHGWLSPMYLEELSYIDDYLEEVYGVLREQGEYLLVITSDHGGHEKDHGGRHPDEAKLPFGVVSDLCGFPQMQNANYRVTDLPHFLTSGMGCTP